MTHCLEGDLECAHLEIQAGNGFQSGDRGCLALWRETIMAQTFYQNKLILCGTMPNHHLTQEECATLKLAPESERTQLNELKSTAQQISNFAERFKLKQKIAGLDKKQKDEICKGRQAIELLNLKYKEEMQKATHYHKQRSFVLFTFLC